jgi:hypothetical protein
MQRPVSSAHRKEVHVWPLILALISTTVAVAQAVIGIVVKQREKGRKNLGSFSQSAKFLIALIALGAIVSLAIATFDSYSSAASKRQADKDSQSLRERLEAISSENRLLRSVLFHQWVKTTKQERLESIALEVDTFQQNEKRSYNSLRELFRFMTGKSLGRGELFAIELKFAFGPLNLHVYGVTERVGERWFYKAHIAGKNRQDFYRTDALAASQESESLLVDISAGSSELDHFLSSSACLGELFRRGSYNRATFDPGYELGHFKVIRSGTLPASARPKDFAQNRNNAPIISRVTIPKEFLEGWYVELSFNGRRVGNLVFKEWSALEEQRDRIQKWVVRDDYHRLGQIWLAPFASDWLDFILVMNGNVQELLYGRHFQRRNYVREVLRILESEGDEGRSKNEK